MRFPRPVLCNLAGEAAMVVYSDDPIKEGQEHRRGADAGEGAIAPFTSNRSNHTRPRSTHRWQRSPGAVTLVQPDGGFPPEGAGRAAPNETEKALLRYSAALTCVSPGRRAFFQSPGASTLLAERISMPMIWPSASTS